MTNKLFLILKWAWKIEFVLSYLNLEKSFGKHMRFENKKIYVLRIEKSAYKKLFKKICENIPIVIFRTIILAMVMSSDMHCGGIHKSGKRYYLCYYDMFLDEYFEKIRKSERKVLIELLKNHGLSHPHYNMIDLPDFVDLETIYDDFKEKRYPIWSSPGGLTKKTLKFIKNEKLKIDAFHNVKV